MHPNIKLGIFKNEKNILTHCLSFMIGLWGRCSPLVVMRFPLMSLMNTPVDPHLAKLAVFALHPSIFSLTYSMEVELISGLVGLIVDIPQLPLVFAVHLQVY